MAIMLVAAGAEPHRGRFLITEMDMEDESTPREGDGTSELSGDSDANDDRTPGCYAQLRERLGRSRSVRRRRRSASAQHFGARGPRMATALTPLERALSQHWSAAADAVEDVEESPPPPNPQSRRPVASMPRPPPPQHSAVASLPYIREFPRWNEACMATEAGEPVRSTLALMINTAIVTKYARPEEVCDWAAQQTADVVFVIFDPDVLRAEERDVAEWPARVALRKKRHMGQPCWHQLGLRCPRGVEVGIAFARCKSIAEATVSETANGDEHTFFIVQVRLVQSIRNPGATLAFAVCARHLSAQAAAGSRGIPHDFVDRAVQLIHRCDVRLLCGLFDFPTEQFEILCRSCGANCAGPVVVWFQAGPWFAKGLSPRTLIAHPNYVVPIGACDLRTATYGENEEIFLPGWMYLVDDSFIARSWFTPWFFPQFGRTTSAVG